MFFLYEYITGGGMRALEPDRPPAGSLLAEGSAMVRCLAEDLLACSATEVILFRDTRLKDTFDVPGCRLEDVRSSQSEREQFAQLAAQADATIVIAPEFAGQLRERCIWATAAGARLLSPDLSFVELASDKHRTADHLQHANVPVAAGRLLQFDDPLPADFSYPAVIKPVDGAGSLGVRLLQSRDSPLEPPPWAARMRLEQFCQGTAASVSVLSGPRAATTLLAGCRQRLSADGHFSYLGGEWPLAPELARRAARLATAVVSALPPTVGYWGMDLVLGNASDGSEDVLIEVNPRLTTSYIGLRRRAKTNLAAAMISIAEGQRVAIEFDDRPLRFDAT